MTASTIHRFRRTAALAAAAAVVGAAGLAAAPAAQAAEKGTVTVVHGIPGLDVDVYVNDAKTLTDFKPGTVTDPLSLDAGSYKIDIYATGTGPTSTPPATPAISDTVELPAGANVSLVAYLKTDGTPSSDLGVFVNDVDPIAAGQARVTVRHVAAAPAVKVTADTTVLAASLTNPNQVTADVPAKTYAVAVAPASGGAAVFETDLPLPEGTSTIVYAYGNLSAQPSTFAVTTQEIDGLAAAPTGVPAGEGPVRDAALPVWLLVTVVAALAVAAAAAGRLALARRG